ncbi:MAG: lipopolysaccharide biosynthesis protein [Planctomycetota bacterium]|nr:lipopolysaccharide biosynthesis protein [Planctomycetota bacterium]
MSFKKKLKRCLPTDSFSRSVGVLAGGVGIAQIIVIASSPLITRLFSPSDFGILSLFVSVVAILGSVSCLCYQFAIPLPEEEEDAFALLVLCFIILAAFTTFVAVVCLVGGASLFERLGVTGAGHYLWFVPAACFLMSAYEILNQWAIRTKLFGCLAQTKIWQGGGMVVSQIGLGLAKTGVIGLLIGELTGRAFGIGALATRLVAEVRRQRLRVSVSRLKAVMSRYRRFPYFSTFSVALNRGAGGVPAILFASLYGPEVAGWLALGERALQGPMILLGQSVASVYVGEGADLLRKSPEELHSLFRTTARRLLFIGLIPIGALGLLGPYLFPFVFGSEWAEAGNYVQILAVSLLLQFVISPLSQTLNILERQDIQLLWDIFRAVLVAGGIAGAYVSSLSPTLAVVIYSASLSVAYAVQLVVISFALKRHRASGTRS